MSAMYTVYTVFTIWFATIIPQLSASEPGDSESQQFLEQLAYYSYRSSEKEADCLRKDKKCFEGLSQEEDHQHHVHVFISFSAPLETWKSYSHELEEINGAFVLRGLPGSSFKELALRIKNLKESGVRAPIYIDPETFHRFHITEIPAIVLEKGKSNDRISGNIPILTALRLFKETGDLKEEAQSLIAQLETQHRRGGDE